MDRIGEMLIRVTGPYFVAGLVIDEDDCVRIAAPVLKWAKGLNQEQLRAELARRELTATIVRTLTESEIKADNDDDDVTRPE
jgi:hypothetical protein